MACIDFCSNWSWECPSLSTAPADNKHRLQLLCQWQHLSSSQLHGLGGACCAEQHAGTHPFPDILCKLAWHQAVVCSLLAPAGLMSHMLAPLRVNQCGICLNHARQSQALPSFLATFRWQLHGAGHPALSHGGEEVQVASRDITRNAAAGAARAATAAACRPMCHHQSQRIQRGGGYSISYKAMPGIAAGLAGPPVLAGRACILNIPGRVDWPW